MPAPRLKSTRHQLSGLQVPLWQVLLNDLDAATADWGVKVTRVEVRDIIPSPDIMAAMELQMSAERRKRADILESEGRRSSDVNVAAGEADAAVLRAEAQSKRLQLESEVQKTLMTT